MPSQCMNRRIYNINLIRRKIAAWNTAKINPKEKKQMTANDVIARLESLCPNVSEV